MFDDEINYFGSNITTTTEKDVNSKQIFDYTQTEKDIKKQTINDTFDDYSAQQNFEEETNYDLKSQTDILQGESQEQTLRPINMPLIEKKIEQVAKVVETPISLSARMKLLLVSFVVIVSSLLFATVWNFVAISKYNLSIANQGQTISELQISITDLTDEYNLLGDTEYLKQLIDDAGYISSDDSNTITITLDEMFEERVVEEIPSNWFNDVCNFISSIFK